MTSGWRKNTVLPIGVEISPTAISAVQLRMGANGAMIQACASEPAALQGDDHKNEMARALQRVMKTAPFYGRECTISLSADRVLTKSVRMPQMPDDDLKQAVQFEAQDRFGFGSDSGMIEFFRAGEVRRGNELRDEVLLFALPDSALKETIEAIETAHMLVHAIDLQPCAILRAMNHQEALKPGQLRTVIDFGDTMTQIMIQQDDRIVFYKNIEIGGLMLDRALADKLGVSVAEATRLRIPFMNRTQDSTVEDGSLEQAVSDAIRPLMDDLMRELDMCLRYYVVTFRGARPESATLTGTQANALRMKQALEQSLNMRIDPMIPMPGLLNPGTLGPGEQIGKWATALGLACYELDDQEVMA